MIEEHGTVIESKDGLALIETVLTDSCESCSSRPLCHGDEDKEDIKRVQAYNPVNAQVGDKVVFQVPTKVVLKAGAMAYFFPMVALVVGIFFGQAFAEKLLPDMDKELVGLATGLAFIVITYGIIRAKSSGSDYNTEYRPTVIKIVG